VGKERERETTRDTVRWMERKRTEILEVWFILGYLKEFVSIEWRRKE